MPTPPVFARHCVPTLRSLALFLAIAVALFAPSPAYGQLIAENAAASANHAAEFCSYNRVASRVLCRVSHAGNGRLFALGSKNGTWAFLLSDGQAKILKNVKENTTVEWASKIRVVGTFVGGVPFCNNSFLVQFNPQGVVDLSCRGRKYGKLVIESKGRRPKRATIDDYGIVRFISATGHVLLTIDPKKGPLPAAAFNLTSFQGDNVKALTTPRRAATTPKRAGTTTPKLKYTTAKAGYLVTPMPDPRNIINPTCRYVPVPYRTGQDPKKIFNIELVSCGSTPAADELFVRAASAWQSIISGDVLDFAVPRGKEVNCLMDFNGDVKMKCSFIDDIMIGYAISPIDGQGNVLGSGKPLLPRGTNWPANKGLPITGWMEFDTIDFDLSVGRGHAYALVMHEMGHVLGFGTLLWQTLSLMSPSNCAYLSETGDVPNPRFLGKASTAALSKIRYTNTSYPPIESSYGPGTACSHWSERYMRHELMTGLMSSTTENTLSYLTVAAFQDMGYTVNFASPFIDFKFDLSAPPSMKDPDTLFNLTGCLQNWTMLPEVPYNATIAGRRAALTKLEVDE